MKTTFEVRSDSYEADITHVGKPEGEKFAIYEATVQGPESSSVKGTLKLTDTALALAAEKAKDQGETAEKWVARGCARSLASEALIRKLQPEFSFVVDHRWIR
jgi:hypothetical protein